MNYARGGSITLLLGTAFLAGMGSVLCQIWSQSIFYTRWHIRRSPRRATGLIPTDCSLCLGTHSGGCAANTSIRSLRRNWWRMPSTAC